MKGLGLFLIFANVASAVQILSNSDIRQVKLQVLRPVAVNYYLLAKNQFADFTVTGIPDTGVWVRIYTRLWFGRKGKSGSAGWYNLSIITADSVRRLRFQTTASRSTQGPAGQTVGRWRSCYLRLTSTVPGFRLLLDSASAETVAVRFLFQAPRAWERLRLNLLSPFTLVFSDTARKNRIDSLFYPIKTYTPFHFTVSGPCRIRLRFRIDYDPTMSGYQNFLVEVKAKDTLLKEHSFRVRPEFGARYQEATGVIPSTEKTLIIELTGGEHQLAVVIKGTPAKTAAVAVERLAGEKYE